MSPHFIPGEFGDIRYSLTGNQSSLFTVDPLTGHVTVAPGAVIDREMAADIWIRAVAMDNAPAQIRRSSSVPVSFFLVFLSDRYKVYVE